MMMTSSLPGSIFLQLPHFSSRVSEFNVAE